MFTILFTSYLFLGLNSNQFDFNCTCIIWTVKHVVHKACATKVRRHGFIHLHLLIFRHQGLCYYTDTHLCLKTWCLWQKVILWHWIFNHLEYSLLIHTVHATFSKLLYKRIFLYLFNYTVSTKYTVTSLYLKIYSPILGGYTLCFVYEKKGMKTLSFADRYLIQYLSRDVIYWRFYCRSISLELGHMIRLSHQILIARIIYIHTKKAVHGAITVQFSKKLDCTYYTMWSC